MTKTIQHNRKPFYRALSIIALAGCTAYLALAIWWVHHLFMPDTPDAKLCLESFSINLTAALCLYLLHRVIRHHCRQRGPRL